MDYMNDPDYGETDDRPKVCAAISYKKGPGGDSDHNFKLHYVDWDNYVYQTIPSQLNYAFDHYQNYIDRNSYTMYARESYSFF